MTVAEHVRHRIPRDRQGFRGNIRCDRAIRPGPNAHVHRCRRLLLRERRRRRSDRPRPERDGVAAEANGYSAEIDGLLDGATCSSPRRTSALAVSSSLSPNNGTVTIVDSSLLVPATVAITNTFVVGKVHIVKTASTSLTEGSATYDYTLAVSNTGTVDAPASR